jgi:hypothetical protein
MIKKAEVICFLVAVGLLVSFWEFSPREHYIGKSFLIWFLLPTSVAIAASIVRTSLLRRLLLNASAIILVGVGYGYLAIDSRDFESIPVFIVAHSSWLALSTVVVLLHFWIGTYFEG